MNKGLVSLWMLSTAVVGSWGQAIDTAKLKGSEILWDTWGVPHFYAQNEEALFYAFGWAQAHNHAGLLLSLYGKARGRAAEYWGLSYLDSDQQVWTLGVPTRAKVWLEAQQPSYRANLEAFAEGINAYLAKHPRQVSSELARVLPVKALDVVAHTHLLMLRFLASKSYAGGMGTDWVMQNWQQGTTTNLPPRMQTGSNAWAIGSSKSVSGKAMLVANPHLLWGPSPYLNWAEAMTLTEAQVNLPGWWAYGATFVGFPELIMAFNPNLGWTHTVNALDGATLYELTLEGTGYRFDDRVQSFERERTVLKVRQPDGSFKNQPLEVRRSVHGPVVATRGDKALALRLVGLDQPGMLQTWWDLAKSKNLAEFEGILERGDLPLLTVMYADQAGHIMHVFNGQVPVRSQGDTNYWMGIVPGDRSSTLWTSIHPYRDLPRVLDPDTGWLQNANDPPWNTTLPAALDPTQYPPYMAPRLMNFRAQRLAKMLMKNHKFSFEDLIAQKHSTREELADRVLGELIPAARQMGSALARQAAEVLAGWDRHTNPDSRGAVLFQFWVEAMNPASLMDSAIYGPSAFAKPWDQKYPTATPSGLADPQAAVRALESAAIRLRALAGRLGVPWGELFRLRRGQMDRAGNGNDGDPFGVVRVVAYAPGANGRLESIAGDSYVAVVEFSNPVRARVLLTYGNSSQTASKHYSDQLELVARQMLRPAWLSRAEVEENLEEREAF